MVVFVYCHSDKNRNVMDYFFVFSLKTAISICSIARYTYSISDILTLKSIEEPCKKGKLKEPTKNKK